MVVSRPWHLAALQKSSGDSTRVSAHCTHLDCMPFLTACRRLFSPGETCLVLSRYVLCVWLTKVAAALDRDSNVLVDNLIQLLHDSSVEVHSHCQLLCADKDVLQFGCLILTGFQLSVQTGCLNTKLLHTLFYACMLHPCKGLFILVLLGVKVQGLKIVLKVAQLLYCQFTVCTECRTYQPRVGSWALFIFIYKLCTCSISTHHFLSKCRKRRLNQGSFVLLCFVLFTLSVLSLVSVLSVFLIFICVQYFSSVNQHEWHYIA